MGRVVGEAAAAGNAWRGAYQRGWWLAITVHCKVICNMEGHVLIDGMFKAKARTVGGSNQQCNCPFPRPSNRCVDKYLLVKRYLYRQDSAAVQKVGILAPDAPTLCMCTN